MYFLYISAYKKKCMQKQNKNKTESCFKVYRICLFKLKTIICTSQLIAVSADLFPKLSLKSVNLAVPVPPTTKKSTCHGAKFNEENTFHWLFEDVLRFVVIQLQNSRILLCLLILEVCLVQSHWIPTQYVRHWKFYHYLSYSYQNVTKIHLKYLQHIVFTVSQQCSNVILKLEYSSKSDSSQCLESFHCCYK